MKFTDPLAFPPKPQPPRTSWWTKPQTREEFSKIAKAEEGRITGAKRFGGRGPTHNKSARNG